jgi:capsular polysaccharide export protein
MKKNFLFVHAHEPDKVIFFSSLSHFFKEECIESTHLTFKRMEESIYKECRVKKTIFMPKHLKEYTGKLDSKKDYDLDSILKFTFQFNSLNNYTFNKEKLYNLAKRFLNFLHDLNNSKPIDRILIWNETFMFDSLAKAFADTNNIPVTLFEAGIFRPHTITVDNKGVNYGNSVPNNTQFYSNLNNESEKKVLDGNFITNTNFYTFNRPILKKNYLLEKIKDIIYTKVFKNELDVKFISEPLSSKFQKEFQKKTKKSDYGIIDLPKDYIFVPFQVHDDSQVILNSPHINHMGQLVDQVYQATRNSNTAIIFKEHPADEGRVDYTDLYNKYSSEKMIFLRDGDTSELITNSKLVITINSTVGIEALERGKPVITLGNAYYNIEGIVSNVKNIAELEDSISDALKGSNDNSTLVKNFIWYLRNEYQVQGEWRSGIFNKYQMKKKMDL